MTDLFDDDDLFAVRATPEPVAAPAPTPRRRRRTPPGFIGPRWPVASLACGCGFRDEVKEPAPDRLDCPHCHALETLARFVPRYLPPQTGGRRLTAEEARGLVLDGTIRL